MTKETYPRLDETLLSFTMENGLTVKIVPRPGFTRKLAYFVTDFGSVHTDFVLEGEQIHAPAGIAHFLEHKMFELPGRDVSAEFAALGANVNAFTSYDMTAYYFSCTGNYGKPSEIYDGFLMLGDMYLKKTGKALTFVPLVIDDEHRHIMEGKAVCVSNFRKECASAADYLKRAINKEEISCDHDIVYSLAANQQPVCKPKG